MHSEGTKFVVKLFVNLYGLAEVYFLPFSAAQEEHPRLSNHSRPHTCVEPEMSKCFNEQLQQKHG